MSSTLRTPPPTVSGMNARRAVRSTMSRSVPRPSGAAVMSRKTSSSAPSRGVALGELGRVALVDEVHEPGALDDPAVRDVEAGDDPAPEHQAALPAGSRRRRAERHDVREQPEAVGPASLGVELDAEQASAGDRARRTGAPCSVSASDRSSASGRRDARRTSGRSRSRRRRGCRRTAGGRGAARPGSSRCAAGSGRPRAGPCGPASTPSVSAPSSSLPSNRSWSPRQIPRYGRSAAIQARIGSTRPPAAQPVHRRRRRPDARDDEQVGARRARRPTRRDRDVGADRRERLLDADEVARAVVDDGDAGGRGRSVIRASPWSTRRRPGAGRARTRRAARAPRALNAASARWWSLRPVPRRWRVAPAVRANASSACSTSWSGSAPARSPRNGRSITAYGRPPTSIDRRRDRLVHRHRGVAEAADPGPIAERLRERRARARARRPRRCGARPRRGRRSARISRSNRPWWASERQEVVVEPDAGLDGRGPGAVEVERDARSRSRGCGARRGPGVPRARDLERAERAWSCGHLVGERREGGGDRAGGLDEAVVLVRVADRDPQALREGWPCPNVRGHEATAHQARSTAASARSAVPMSSSRKFVTDGSGFQPAASSAAASRGALALHAGDVRRAGRRVAQRPRSRSSPRPCRPTRGPVGRRRGAIVARLRDGEPDPQAGERVGLGGRPDHDQRSGTARAGRSGPSGELRVRLVDDDRRDGVAVGVGIRLRGPSRRRSIAPSGSGSPVGLFGPHSQTTLSPASRTAARTASTIHGPAVGRGGAGPRSTRPPRCSAWTRYIA